MKKRIDIIAGVETYTNLQSFKDIGELNDAVRAYKERFKEVLTKSAVKVLEYIQRYSAKYTGVSFRTKNKIANELEISRRTVIRACQLLDSLGIIKQYEMKRSSDMQQTSNAIVIQPIEEEKEEVVTQEVPKMSHQENNFSLKQNNIKNNNTRNDVPQISHVDNSFDDSINQVNFVAHWVPERFTGLVGSFYSEAKTIQEFWKVIKQSNRVVDYTTGARAFTKDQELTIATKAFKEYAMKVKSGMQISNKFGYYNGIVNKLMDKLNFDMDFIEG
ncbi:helix-turn-helix domain-containing protein [Peribacillus loiseleuriae]|uniref:helix-turn-helix domain-containing protein n=1 Tax=Peribacillus loiseleuriae TaxID=1679170 RepID=UPI003D0350EB